MHFVFTLSSACGLLCCRATWLVKPVIFSFNALRTLYVINSTTMGVVFRARLHINYCKCYNYLHKIIMRIQYRIEIYSCQLIAFVAINLVYVLTLEEEGNNFITFL